MVSGANAHWRVALDGTGGWINQSSDIFDTLPPIGDKKSETGQAPIFATYSAGLKTNRDTWCYNFSRAAVEQNMGTLIDTYNQDIEAFRPTGSSANQRLDEAKAHATYDDTRISWNRGTFKDFAAQKRYAYNDGALRLGTYRPFTKQHVYFDRQLVDMIYQLPSMFPTPAHDNYGFYLTAPGSGHEATLLATDQVPDLAFWGSGSGQFFPRYTWERVEDAEPDLLSGLDDSGANVVVDGYRRIDNITNATLTHYQEAFGDDVTKGAIFAHIYALLHSQQYRSAFAAELKRRLPRIPLPASSSDFWSFASAGQKLLDLHINYEEVEPCPLEEETTLGGASDPGLYQVQKMKWGGKANAKDKSRLIYNTNITLTGIQTSRAASEVSPVATTEATASREWSSISWKITALPPPVSTYSVASSCHKQFGAGYTNRR